MGQSVEPDAGVRLDHYRQANLQEKVFVHTDRDFYLTGDQLWLKVYLVDASAHKPLYMSKVVYVDILDNQGQALVQGKVAIDNAIGHTSLFLPATLNSGNYTLRAYTRWMKNYSPVYFFHKRITIVNPFKPLGLQAQAPVPEVDAQFFPEGGNLVAGLTSRVGFRVVYPSGLGLQSFQGRILNARDDTVASFEPHRFGLGSFDLTPENDMEYRAVISDSLGAILAVRKLPEVSNTGYVLTLRDIDAARITLSIQSNDPAEASGDVTVLMHTRLASIKTISTRMVGGRASIEIPKTSVGDGITHFTLFDGNDRPVCERLYFKAPEHLLRIEATPDRKTVGQRSKISLNVTTQADGEPLPAQLSVAVFRLDSLQSAESQNIANYLLLTGDLPGRVESPSYYFSGAADVSVCADNLMLTHGWRRFTWEDIFQDDRKAPSIEPEYRGHLITGHLFGDDGNPARGIPVYLSVPGKRFHFTGTKSKVNGDLIFELPGFYGQGNLILQTDWTRDSTYRIVLDQPFSDTVSDAFLPPPLTLDERIKGTLLSRSINMQLDNAYLEEEKNKNLPPNTDTLTFYRTPDQRYYLDDYTRFGVMEEVMREYVSAIAVRKRKDQFYFRTLNKKNNELFEDNPLVLLDGVPVFDINQIMAYDPLKVWRLDIVSSRYYYGKLSFKGIASYSTYTGNLPDFPLDQRALVTEYEGMRWQREFYSPVYELPEQIENRIPDVRTVLFWAPEVLTGTDGTKTLTFYSGDLPGRYLISVQGLTDTGLPGAASAILDVNEREND